MLAVWQNDGLPNYSLFFDFSSLISLRTGHGRVVCVCDAVRCVFAHVDGHILLQRHSRLASSWDEKQNGWVRRFWVLANGDLCLAATAPPCYVRLVPPCLLDAALMLCRMYARCCLCNSVACELHLLRQAQTASLPCLLCAMHTVHASGHHAWLLVTRLQLLLLPCPECSSR